MSWNWCQPLGKHDFWAKFCSRAKIAGGGSRSPPHTWRALSDVTLARVKPETNGILTKNHFNICTRHPICIKLTKFDTKWRLKKKCSIIWNIYITLSVILAYSMNFSDWNIQILAFSFLFVVRKLELFIGIKDQTFGCNVYLFCLKIKFKVVDFKKIDY